MKLTESQITKQIRDVLNACNIWHFKHWSGALTYPKGIADIIGIYNNPSKGHYGVFLAIEVKRPGLKPTEAQQDFLDSVNEAGGIGFVAWFPEDVIRELNLEVELMPLFNQEENEKAL